MENTCTLINLFCKRALCPPLSRLCKYMHLPQATEDDDYDDDEAIVNEGNYQTKRGTLRRFLTEPPVLVWADACLSCPSELPSEIRIVCGNAAGATDQQHLVERMDHICVHDADLVLLQEVSPRAIPKALGAYPHKTTLPTHANSSVFLMVASKFPWTKAEYYSMPGTLAYDNSVLLVQFGGVMVINLYLQAGCWLSGCIEPALLPHFHDCRAAQMRFILGKAQEARCRSVIWAGDFNIDWNGSSADWPEMEVMQHSGVTDVMQPKPGGLPLYTEDSEANLLRQARRHKQVRFDTAFCSPGIECVSARLIWTEPFQFADGSGLWHPSDHAGIEIRVRFREPQ